jgi:hypothetical protein
LECRCLCIFAPKPVRQGQTCLVLPCLALSCRPPRSHKPHTAYRIPHTAWTVVAFLLVLGRKTVSTCCSINMMQYRHGAVSTPRGGAFNPQRQSLPPEKTAFVWTMPPLVCTRPPSHPAPTHAHIHTHPSNSPSFLPSCPLLSPQLCSPHCCQKQEKQDASPGLQAAASRTCRSACPPCSDVHRALHCPPTSRKAQAVAGKEGGRRGEGRGEG